MEVASQFRAHGTPVGYRIDAAGRIASELTVGGEPLLPLAAKFAPPEARVSRRGLDANRAKAAALGLSFPIVVQGQWEISREYGMFATPIAYRVDEEGILQSDVAVGVGPILALAEEPLREPEAKRWASGNTMARMS